MKTKQFLSTIGDDLQRAVASGVDSVEFNNEQILYKQLDTVDARRQSPTDLQIFY